MSEIQLDYQVGIISGFYFILFDLILLTLVDIVLSKLVNFLYYRRINAGVPLSVQSADIPGVTTFLVGRYISFPNVVTLSIKLAFLMCIVVIERGINSKLVRSFGSITTSGTFRFNPSDDIWGAPIGERIDHRTVARRWERVRQCRKVSPDSNTITFYHINFDLVNNVVVFDEVDNQNPQLLHDVNDSTITCLSPDNVEDKFVKPLQKVHGCSQLIKSTCTNETSWEIQAPLPEKIPGQDDTSRLVFVDTPSGVVTLSADTYTDETVFNIFPQLRNDMYSDAELTCGETKLGVKGKDRIFMSCMLVVTVDGNNTLVERFNYDNDREVLQRQFPGPIFEGRISYGKTQRYNLMVNMNIGLNWETFAATLIAEAMIYERVVVEVRTYKENVMTTVPLYAVILGCCLLGVSIVARIMVAFTIGRDERPQLNSIDGLSSIAREEQAPSGRSLVRGQGVVLGLSKSGFSGNVVHFGPMSKQECVKRTASVVVE